MRVELRATPFDPWQELAAHQATRQQADASGASVVFVGSMRSDNEGDEVLRMWLEHYPGMTEKTLLAIGQRAMANHRLHDVLVLHRTGNIFPGEAIVLVAAWSAHRKEAFEASRQIMEALKSGAPFWKKEWLADGSTRWVTQNTPGY